MHSFRWVTQTRRYLFQFVGVDNDIEANRAATLAAAAVASTAAARRSCFPCSGVSLNRYQDRLSRGRRSYALRYRRTWTGSGSARVDRRPIAFRTDATATETATALLP